jgi:chromosome segregation ATPase
MQSMIIDNLKQRQPVSNERVFMRAFLRAMQRTNDYRMIAKAQEAKIAEQAAALDRRLECMDIQAFQLGDQDRQLREAKEDVAAARRWIIDLEAELGRLRGTSNFQVAELQRLKAALAKSEAERDGWRNLYLAAIACVEALAPFTEQLKHAKRIIAELEAEREAYNARAAEQEAKIAELKAALNALDMQGAAMAIVEEAAAQIPADQWEEADVAGWRAMAEENSTAFMEWYTAHKQGREATLEADLAEREAALIDYQASAAIAADRNRLQEAKVAELEAALAELKTERDEWRKTPMPRSKELEAYSAKVAELEAEREENAGSFNLELYELDKKFSETKAALTLARARIAELEAEHAEWEKYGAGTIKALTADVERLKGIAEHSNNLAQTRLEEAAKLRREVAELKKQAAPIT